MRKAILWLSAIVLLGLPMSLAAQDKTDSKEQRKAKFEQFCRFRRDYMMKQIELTDQEAKQFFPLYEELESKNLIFRRVRRSQYSLRRICSSFPNPPLLYPVKFAVSDTGS